MISERELRLDGPADAAVVVALAHGAGAPMDSPFMTFFAEGLGARGVRVARFEFPYMAQRRSSGRRRPPDRTEILLERWREVVAALGPASLVIGGKSLGGRMASMLADEAGVRGLVCLGYPFHPPGRPEATRIQHLRTLRLPTLILQGTRDPFGSPEQIASYGLPECVRLHWLADGDHDFSPRAVSSRTKQQNWQEALRVLAGFLGALFGERIR